MKIKRQTYQRKNFGQRSHRGFKSWRSGIWAEYLALVWLGCKFYRIIARRKMTPYGEVDLVAIHKKSLVVVEVKLRRSRREALEAVTPHQQRNLIRAADWVMAHYHRSGCQNSRIDLVAFGWWQRPIHIVDVFRNDRPVR
ncbi:MAG: YraN family protein [Candidatus Pacebacteria bacterium]|nr:YraN family protein [Candidatus Paceibacterota bacterium]